MLLYTYNKRKVNFRATIGFKVRFLGNYRVTKTTKVLKINRNVL